MQETTCTLPPFLFMIRIYFGNIGCGKTTTAVRKAYKILKFNKKILKKYNKTENNKKRSKLKNKVIYEKIYANFENNLTRFKNLKDLGNWTLPFNSYLLVDEAGIEYNNRKFKTLPQHTIEWYKLSRHYGVDVDIFSQSWEDMDITLRRLASELWFIKKIGPFTMLRKIRKFIAIDENTKQIIDGYKFEPIIFQFLPFPFHRHCLELFLRKPYYKYFDSFSTPTTEVRE